MKVNCVWEHNGDDSILYANNFVGAFTRGSSIEEAILKMPEEIRRFQLWIGETPPDNYDIEIVQEKVSDLQIKDADSDVLSGMIGFMQKQCIEWGYGHLA